MRDYRFKEQHDVLIGRDELAAAIAEVHGAKPLLVCRRPGRPPRHDPVERERFDGIAPSVFHMVFLCFDRSQKPVNCEPGDLR